MSKITVYAFTVYDQIKDYHPKAKGMATKEIIENIKGANIILSESAVVDSSQLTQSKRYHPD